MNKMFIGLLSTILISSFITAQDYKPVVTDANRAAFISAAKEYIGVPYLWGGRTKKGVDCSGLVYAAAQKSLNVTIPHSAVMLYEQSVIIPALEREPGDLVFFKTGAGDEITHVGIYIGDGEVIHALSEGKTPGVTITPLSRQYWVDAYVCSGRLMESAEAARTAASQKKGWTAALAQGAGSASSAAASSSGTAGGSASGTSSSGSSRYGSFGAGFDALRGYWNLLNEPYTGIEISADSGSSFGLSFSKGTNLFHINGSVSTPIVFSFDYLSIGAGFGSIFPVSRNAAVGVDVMYTQFIDIASSATTADESDFFTSVLSRQIPSVRVSFEYSFLKNLSVTASIQGDIGISSFNTAAMQYRPYLFSIPSADSALSVNMTAGIGIKYTF